MQKTKMGISVGFLGAAIYLTCLFTGYLVPVILTGYVLLCEENEWLRRSAVKAVTLLIFFSFISALVYLIPDAIGLIDNIFNIFNGSFSVTFLMKIVNVFQSVLGIVEKLLFMGLGLKALNQRTVSVPVVDKPISKHM